MLRIVNSSFELQAIISNITESKVTEAINGEYILEVECVADNKVAQYVNENYVIADGTQYFDIAYYEKSKNEDGTTTIKVQGEHISYRLNEDDLTFFTRASETPTQILDALLVGTDFTSGTVNFATPMTYSILEEQTKRQILVGFVEFLGGELSFDGTEISIITRRGDANPKLYTANKNVTYLAKVYDRGAVKYECKGINIPSQAISLGDNVLLVDSDLGLKDSLRIVRLSYSLNDDMDVDFEIANKIETLADSFYRIETETIAKEKVYNGTRIGPDEGFVAERSDLKAKTVMNATEGITVFTRSNILNPYVANLTIDVDGNIVMTGKITLSSGSDVSTIGLGDLAFLNSVTNTEITDNSISTAKIQANAVTANEINVLTLSALSADLGTITAGSITAVSIGSSTITGTTMTIGTGNNVFKVTTSGIHLGHANFADAPFSVNLFGELKAENAEIQGLFQTKGTLGNISTELFADATGGYAAINNDAGYRNLQIGSEPTNDAGLILVFNGEADVLGSFQTRIRIAAGVFEATNCGYMTVYRPDAVFAATLRADPLGSFLLMNNDSENRVVQLGTTAGTYQTGNLFCYDEGGDVRARFGVDATNETGVMQLYNSIGNIVVEGLVNSVSGGECRVKNIAGNTRVTMFVTTSGDSSGRLGIYDGSGNLALLRYNGTNLQVSKSGGAWINIA